MKVMAVDGNNILNRAFYAIRPLSTSKGQPTNALFGFLNILLKHLQEEKPDRIMVAFDRKAKTFRHALYNGYKATRTGMPDDLAAQLQPAKDLLSALRITIAEQDGLEADDILGMISRRCKDQGDQCVIVSGDRDVLQLINEKVSVKLLTNKEDILFNKEKVMEKYGLSPEQLIDLKALMGDSSDNIPGVKGVGEKTALSLLSQYQTLDGVFENADKIKGALGEKIRGGKDRAYLSKTLGTILLDGDFPLQPDEISVFDPDKKALSAFLEEMEMTSFLKRFDFSGEEETARPAEKEPEETENLSPEIFGQTVFLLFRDNQTLLLNGECYTRLPDAELHRLQETKIVTHDAKPFIAHCLKQGFFPPVIFDTMLAAYLLDPAQTAYPAVRLCKEFTGKNPETDLAALPILPSLYHTLLAELKKNGQKKLLDEIELPLCFVLAEMENTGIGADIGFLKEFGESSQKEIARLTDEIYQLAGKEFNINSPKQLGEILFETLLLPMGKKTKTGYSTNNEVLESLLGIHPIIEKIILFRRMTKLQSTYVDALIEKADENGRIHSNFTQTVTQTGRISSVDPNLQNIPVRTEIGRQLRHAFRAKKGCQLIDADYSQIELRILAHITEDKTMQEAFLHNEDIHTSTAAKVFGLPPQMITPQLRSRAKAVNFGIVYGIGEFSLAKDLKIPRKEAKEYIDGYLANFSGVKKYMTEIVEFAKEHGYVQTLFGRRRYVPEINMKNKQVQAFGKRICLNTPIQGTAADLIKIAMIRVTNELKKQKLEAKLVLQVHDELIVEAPDCEVETVKKILKTEMENAASLSVPLTADVNSGNDWFDAH